MIVLQFKNSKNIKAIFIIPVSFAFLVSSCTDIFSRKSKTRNDDFACFNLYKCLKSEF